VLLLDKPVGISSNHALQAVKRLYRAEKAGHAGTLDPLASGLLPVLLGEATRFSGYLLDAPKCYEAEVRLGATTTTADAEGEILERKPVDVDEAKIAGVLGRFVGAQTQVPPMYSALKRAGTPLYVLARRGETVERAPRSIHIHSLDLLVLTDDRLLIRVACSKGTYIRTLAEDIGAALGCGAHLSALRRTGTGAFDIGEGKTLDALATLTEEGRDALLRPAEAILGQLPRIDLDQAAETRFCHGQPLVMEGIPQGVCRVYGAEGRFLGLAEEREPGWLAAKRLLGERSPGGSPTG
jgi:tRNA pseudouridine55 synthase